MAVKPLARRKPTWRKGDGPKTLATGWDEATGPPNPHTITSGFPTYISSGYSPRDPEWPDTSVKVSYVEPTA